VPIIIVSARDAADFRALALAAGCDEYVTKPVEFDNLESIIRKYCPTPPEVAAAHMAA
jgi:DNA-binding response OmpR family regulator